MLKTRLSPGAAAAGGTIPTKPIPMANAMLAENKLLFIGLLLHWVLPETVV
jgi:hypothetical protein